MIYTLVAVTFLSYYGVLAQNCLNDASYNDETKRCECNAGFSGLGDLCCDQTDEWMNCNLGGDPWLSTFVGSRMPFNWPCMTTLSVIEGRRCNMRVVAGSSFVQRGALYPTSISVSIENMDGATAVFTFTEDTVQKRGLATVTSGANVARDGMEETWLGDQKIVIKYRSGRKMWKIRACNSRVAFRAAQDNKPVQEMGPGVCVAVKRSGNAQPTGNVGAGDICSATPTNIEGVTSLERMPCGVLTNVLKVYDDIMADFENSNPRYINVCGRVNNIVTNRCDSDIDRIRPAVDHCSAILYSGQIKLCMSLMGAGGPQVTRIFANCLRYHCSPNVNQCQAYVDGSAAVKTCFRTFCPLLV